MNKRIMESLRAIEELAATATARESSRLAIAELAECIEQLVAILRAHEEGIEDLAEQIDELSDEKEEDDAEEDE